MRKLCVAMVFQCVFPALAWSQGTVPTTVPATVPAKNARAARRRTGDLSTLPPDIRAAIEAAQKTIDDQNKRIAALEARQDDQEKARRDEIVAVLKEMKLLGDQRANDIHVYYKDGLKLDTSDGNFHMGINGRIYDDWAWISASGVSKSTGVRQTDGTEIREARMKMSGDFYKDYFYCLELDFANGGMVPKDIWIGMRNIPLVGAVRVGHFQEPFSLDDLLSDMSRRSWRGPLPRPWTARLTATTASWQTTRSWTSG